MTRMQLILLLVQVAFAAALLWSCFCRLVKTDAQTHQDVRWSIVLELVAAGLVLGAPALPALMPEDARWAAGETPRAVWLFLLVAATVRQLVTARFWTDGCAPSHYRRAGASAAIPPGRGWSAFAAILLTTVGLAGASQPAVVQANAPGADVRQIHTLRQGESVDCSAAEGCVAMTGFAFRTLLDAAERLADQAALCRAKRST